MDKLEKAIRFTQGAHVDDSKGLPALLLGDVARLIEMSYGH